jgi:putative transposase
MVRHSLNYVSWKRRPEVAADLKRIYQSATADEAEQRLGEFEAKWDAEYLPIGQSWRRNWARLIPFFDYPPEIRKVIYTTNAIESVNMSLRKLTKNRGSFPSDEALLKLFYLALRNISRKWTMPIRDWKAALTRFTIQFEERLPQPCMKPRLHKKSDRPFEGRLIERKQLSKGEGTYARVSWSALSPSKQEPQP